MGDLVSQIILIIAGVVLTMFFSYRLKNSRLKAAVGGVELEAGHKTIHQIINIENLPLSSRFLNTPGNIARDLQASLYFNEKATISFQDKSFATQVTTIAGVEWYVKEKTVISVLVKKVTIAPGNFAQLRIFTKKRGTKGYEIAGSNTNILEPKKTFTLSITNGENISQSWDIIVINNDMMQVDIKNSDKYILGMETVIKKTRFSINTRLRIMKFKFWLRRAKRIRHLL